jgi:hypothetical protein
MGSAVARVGPEAHLTEANRAALLLVMTQNGYQEKVHRAAEEGAQHNFG